MTDKTTLDYLIEARTAIASPESWCRHSRNSHGARCAIGALDYAHGDNFYGDINRHPPTYQEAVAAIVAALPPGRIFYDDKEVTPENFQRNTVLFKIAGYNNTNTHAEVLALFDRAIARQRVIEDRTLAAPLPEAANEPANVGG